MSSSKTSKISKKTHKIIFLGDSGVGKTCIIDRFANNKYDEYFNPTIGIDFVSKDIKYKGNSCRMQLWDTAGQEKFKSLVPTYLKDAVCCVLVFDVSKPVSLVKLQEWINFFRQNKKERAISIICGNKGDLEKNFEKERLEQLIEKYKMAYFCVSAKTGNNIEELFYKIAEMLQSQQIQKMNKIKKKYTDDYENPPTTVQSLTRGDTKESSLQVKEEDKLALIQNEPEQRCKC